MRVILSLAEMSGRVVRSARSVAVGVAGVACVALGLGLVYPPLGLIAVGVALLVLDWRAS